MSTEEVLAIIPAYNEESTIAQVINSLREEGLSRIVVVDDGSSDSTATEAARAGAKVLRHIMNRGPGAATQTGLDYARRTSAPCAVTIDADYQHDPKDVELLLDAVREDGADMVIGNRFMKGTNYIPGSRVLYNALANVATYLFSSHWVSDTQSGYKAFSRKAIERLRLSHDGFAFCSEIIIKAQRARLRIAEVPIRVNYSPETIRKGQGLGTGVRTLANLVQGYILK